METTLIPLTDDEEGYEVRWCAGVSFVAYVYRDTAEMWRPYGWNGKCLNPGWDGFDTPIQAAYWGSS
jgi:hypothetical protein